MIQTRHCPATVAKRSNQSRQAAQAITTHRLRKAVVEEVTRPKQPSKRAAFPERHSQAEASSGRTAMHVSDCVRFLQLVQGPASLSPLLPPMQHPLWHIWSSKVSCCLRLTGAMS
eukprot:51470-Eustigmatos_ZCMA.PRE.1